MLPGACVHGGIVYAAPAAVPESQMTPQLHEAPGDWTPDNVLLGACWLPQEFVREPPRHACVRPQVYLRISSPALTALRPARQLSVFVFFVKMTTTVSDLCLHLDLSIITSMPCFASLSAHAAPATLGTSTSV
jgi:hypothetical protein